MHYSKALLDSLDAGVAAVAPDWTIVEWSSGAAEITGLPAHPGSSMHGNYSFVTDHVTRLSTRSRGWYAPRARQARRKPEGPW